FLAIDERDNKLVDEAKNLPSQRVVPVSAPAFGSIGSSRNMLRRAPTAASVMPRPLFGFGSIAKPLSSDESCEVKESCEIDDSSAPTSVKSKPPKIETLYNFLDLQSFDGSFLPSTKFYSWFDKKDFKDFEIIGIENEKVLCLALAMAYLEIIMFETFKEESEM
ncbi:31095_t:CDS:1, partial [Racocetra persica]